MWVDAAEDDWAWGDHAQPPSLRAKAKCVGRSELGMHAWIAHCASSFRAVQNYSGGVICLRATLVIVPVSLLGQWADESRDFAPRLKVVTWHSCAHKDPKKPWGAKSTQAEIMARFGTADLILTTSGMAAKLLGYRFHRIVVDEVRGHHI